MKCKANSFGVKLWLSFALFASFIFIMLWLMQTVFLQSFYEKQVIRNAEKTAEKIYKAYGGDNFDALLDTLAYENSLLILLTDFDENVIYTTNEHSNIYYKGNEYARHEDTEKSSPYYGFDEMQNWQRGRLYNTGLPKNYSEFLQKLAESETSVGYKVNDGSSYIYGMILPDEEYVLYISTSLEAVGSAVSVLRVQLIWATVLSLLLSFAIAYFLARRFSHPMSALSSEARHLADGSFKMPSEKGFCSELDELAEVLEQSAADLQKSESFRKEFIANISHDLRTPLTMIRGYAEMIKDISWEDAKQKDEDLSVIIREADRLTGLVNDILDYSSLQSANTHAEFEKFDISAAACEVIKQIEALCGRNSVKIISEIEPDIKVNGICEQITRVLYNLLDNAITHSEKMGKIEFTLKRADNAARIEVRDFGGGIAAEDLPYIWDRYFTQKQQKRGEKSSGLGLAISKEILLTHGAKYGAESEEGQGSIFWFEIAI